MLSTKRLLLQSASHQRSATQRFSNSNSLLKKALSNRINPSRGGIPRLAENTSPLLPSTSTSETFKQQPLNGQSQRGVPPPLDYNLEEIVEELQKTAKDEGSNSPNRDLGENLNCRRTSDSSNRDLRSNLKTYVDSDSSRNPMSTSILANPAWYRDDAGRTGFCPSDYTNIVNLQRSTIKKTFNEFEGHSNSSILSLPLPSHSFTHPEKPLARSATLDDPINLMVSRDSGSFRVIPTRSTESYESVSGTNRQLSDARVQHPERRRSSTSAPKSVTFANKVQVNEIERRHRNRTQDFDGELKVVDVDLLNEQKEPNQVSISPKLTKDWVKISIL